MKNMTKLLSVILIPALLICTFPVTASAADYAPGDGETLDISACVNGDVITIGEGRSVTLTGNSVTLTGVRIICEAGVNLTLQNIIIDNNAYSGVCPLRFTGADSKLILESATTSTLTGGATAPGISMDATAELTVENNGTLTTTGGLACAGLQCPDGAELTVSGSGTLNASARGSLINGGGAGIGGGKGQKSGTMTFLSGTVNATGAMSNRMGASGGGAGIGGGGFAACGRITIEGGTITAIGGGGSYYRLNGYAGIGGADITITAGTVRATGFVMSPGIGGFSNSGSTIAITGGTVTATGGRSGMGIGGFNLDFPDPKVTIEGGTVYATGGNFGAGIGGISSHSGGEIEISGGMVYASAGSADPAPKDIGPGTTGTDGTLSITGTAMVFLKNNLYTAPTTTTHTNFT